MDQQFKRKVVGRALFLAWGLSIIAALIGPWAIRMATLDLRAPVAQFRSGEALNSPVLPGGVLAVRVYRDKQRNDCPLDVHTQATNADGKPTILRIRKGVPGGDKDMPYWTGSFDIPKTMPPGEYLLQSHLAYYCPGLSDPFVYDQPTIPFRVVAKKGN